MRLPVNSSRPVSRHRAGQSADRHGQLAAGRDAAVEQLVELVRGHAAFQVGDTSPQTRARPSSSTCTNAFGQSRSWFQELQNAYRRGHRRWRRWR